MWIRTAICAFVVVLGCRDLDARAQTANSIEVAFPELRFVRPVDIQHAADSSNRLFVVEQAGVIKVFDNNPGVSAAKEFLDIRDRVNDGGKEEGLLGLAFHPDYSNNELFYVYYTGKNPRHSVLARYRVRTGNPDSADPDNEEVILRTPQPMANHNGGQIAFGPDGYLYIALGDGGGANDPNHNGQDRTSLLGAILRIDVDNPGASGTYGIPADNPFAGNNVGFREEIYAYGLRNPWRFSFDPPTGRLFAADVGQRKYEEIDVIENGGNYGWRTMEGLHCSDTSPICDPAGFVSPIHEYFHHGESKSVTGGFVYRGQGVPELQGLYVYADYVDGTIWALEYDGTDQVQNTELIKTSLNISSFGVDEQHELYIAAFDGQLYRFTPTNPGSSLSFDGWIGNQQFVAGREIMDLVFPAAGGGTAPYSYLLSPDPPPGLAFDALVRTLSGTPSDTSSATRYSYTATDAVGTAGNLSFTISVSPTPTSTYDESELPQDVVLHGNYPNPFSNSTHIILDLPRTANVAVEVLDMLGRGVVTLPSQSVPAGRGQRLSISGATVPAGTYLYRVTVDTGERQQVKTGLMLVIR